MGFLVQTPWQHRGLVALENALEDRVCRFRTSNGARLPTLVLDSSQNLLIPVPKKPKMASKMCHNLRLHKYRPGGEIGRLRGLKIPRRKACRFESGPGHHIKVRTCPRRCGLFLFLSETRLSIFRGVPWKYPTFLGHRGAHLGAWRVDIGGIQTFLARALTS